MLTCLVIMALLQQAPADRLEVIARIPPGTYVPGQAIEIRVGVVAREVRPGITLPAIAVDQGEIALIEEDFRQVGASGIGDVVEETNLYIGRYIVVPRRPGTLRIPPFRADLDGRRGAATPLQVEVQPLPVGRPPTFLGGVGSVAVRASARPERIRLGESLEYTLTLEGPGARGSLQVPTLDPLLSKNPGLEVTAGRGTSMMNPPARTFRWTLRPDRAGELVLPPVLVSTYNARTRQFDTRSAPGIGVTVADVPRFEISAFDYGRAGLELDAAWAGTALAAQLPTLLGMSGLGIASVLILLARWRRAGRRPSRRVRLWLRRTRVAWGSIEPSERSRWMLEKVGELCRLGEADGSGAGPLSPGQVESNLLGMGLSDAFAGTIRGLVETCERDRYGEPAGPELERQVESLWRSDAEKA